MVVVGLVEKPRKDGPEIQKGRRVAPAAWSVLAVATLRYGEKIRGRGRRFEPVTFAQKIGAIVRDTVVGVVGITHSPRAYARANPASCWCW